MIEVTKAGNDSYTTYGFSNFYEKGKVFVNGVVETSSAADFLKNGDQIIRVNNINYNHITEADYCEIRRNDDRKGTGSLEITIVRAGETHTFHLNKTKIL